MPLVGRVRAPVLTADRLNDFCWPSGNAFELTSGNGEIPSCGFFTANKTTTANRRRGGAPDNGTDPNPTAAAERCTCRGRCRGHAQRPLVERRAEQDLEEEEAPWPPPYPWPYAEDFRAPLDVPSDHPTYEQEMLRRRAMIHALNRVMKAREETLWKAYATPVALAKCIETRCDALARRALARWLAAASTISAPSSAVTTIPEVR